MAVTLKDVAQKAGVSYTAASFVLNNKNLSDVSDEKRKRILKAIRELNYRPHAGARSLRRKQFGTVGLLFDGASLNTFRGNSDLIAGVNEKLIEADYNMISYISRVEYGAKKDMPRMFAEHSVDGIVAVGRIEAGTLKEVKELGIPAIFVNNTYWDEVDCIKPDDFNGMSRATRHLIELGHKKILYIKPEADTHPSVVDRYNGYLRAMEEAGLEPLEPFIVSYDELQTYMPIFQSENPPTAILGDALGNVVNVCYAALQMGLKLSHDVSIIGGDSGGASDIIYIDYIHIPQWDMGVRAVELLLRKIQNGNQPVHSEVVSERLVLRGSSGPPNKK